MAIILPMLKCSCIVYMTDCVFKKLKKLASVAVSAYPFLSTFFFLSLFIGLNNGLRMDI